MTQRRCFLPDPEEPGSLQLLIISLCSHCGPFQLSCLKGALDKWLSLFTVQIIEYTLTEMGIILLAYVPNKLLGVEEARERTQRFDHMLQSQQKGLWWPRSHDYTPERLNNLSEFMALFVRDFMERHKKVPVPKDLPEGYYPLPRKAGRFKSKTIQHTALPPVFNDRQLDVIRSKLRALGFSLETTSRDLRELHMSSHGIGGVTFLEKLEARSLAYLLSLTKKPVPRQRCPQKKIVPFDEETWDRCIGEALVRHPYERYPLAWNCLIGIGSLKKILSCPESFRNTPKDSPVALEGMVINCLPMTLSLMLADGLLRWYYRVGKGVEFPRCDDP